MWNEFWNKQKFIKIVKENWVLFTILVFSSFFWQAFFILYLYNGNISTLAFFIFLFFFVSTITSPCFSRLYEIAGCLAGCVHIDCIYIWGIGVNSWIHVWNGNEAEQQQQQQNIYMEENSLLGIPNSSETRWRKTTTSGKSRPWKCVWI